ncbi:MAG TPA: efflux RND transporter periplasmic adaptor subunit, partial [Chthoniobacterales bacterium]
TYDTQRYSVTQLQALVAADDAAIYNAQTQLDYTRIVAPISGRIGLRLIDVGNMIHSSDSNGILVINEIQPISVVFTLPQQDLAAVRKAQQGGKPLTVLALDRDNLSTLATGVLEVVDNQIDAATATVKLKAKFENTDDALWPGQFVNVRLQLGVESGAISVPDAAVQRGPNGSYVYVIGADHTVSMRTIATGASEGGSTLVTSGLKAGERIVVDGQYRLQPGAKVTETSPTSTSPTAQ